MAFEFLDFLAVQNLVYRYTMHIDHGELDEMAQLFQHADVIVDAGTYSRDPAGLAAVFKEYVHFYPDGTPRTRHVTTNLIVEPDGENRAKATSSVIVFQQTDEFPLQPVIGTRNHDRFEKVDGQWRFAERRIEMNLYGDLSAHMLLPVSPR